MPQTPMKINQTTIQLPQAPLKQALPRMVHDPQAQVNFRTGHMTDPYAVSAKDLAFMRAAGQDLSNNGFVTATTDQIGSMACEGMRFSDLITS